MTERITRTAPAAWLARLLRDQRGNTVAIIAAAVVPLAAMIGSGVDMSRDYLVKSRLQQACDAGALGGRRAMGGNSWSPATDAVARSYFRTNFNVDAGGNGPYGTSNISYGFTEADGTVTGTASATVPTSIMKIFGYNSMAVAVTCAGKMKIPNSDIMFVLDTTGSMAQTASSSDTQPKIAALKQAVQNFYQTLETAKGLNTRIRYGFVPYSSDVNVGFLLQRDWMVNNATYQSRVATRTGNYITKTTESGWSPVSGSYASSNAYKAASCPANSYTSSTTSTTDTTTADDGTITTVTTYTKVENGRKVTSCSQLSGGKYSYKSVVYSQYTTKDIKTTVKKPTYTWTYQPVSYDVSGLKGNNADGTMAGGSITAGIGNLDSDQQPTALTTDWDGCIEERDTVQNGNFSGGIPSGAFDLDIDLIPNSDATRWKPSLPGLTFGRALGASPNSWSVANYVSSANFYNPQSWGYYTCPAPARKLAEIPTATDLNSYLAQLTPSGSTYHDIGMIWGGRLISPTGLFAAENTTAPNGGQISRHIIFMTDGVTQPSQYVYNAYGLDPLNRRKLTSNSDANLTTDIEARMGALCTAIKNKNITIWVVAFGTSLTPMLNNCASPGRAYQANNAAQLDSAFTTIATQIAQLRLVS